MSLLVVLDNQKSLEARVLCIKTNVAKIEYKAMPTKLPHSDSDHTNNWLIFDQMSPTTFVEGDHLTRSLIPQ